MIDLALLLLTAAGFACLCASVARHQPALFGRALPKRRARILKRAGWSMLALATMLACINFGSGYGLVEALGFASLGALAAMALLSRATRQNARR
ncbi:hypothetical protein FHR22_003923 [Sphingopyxis panaciterrae]|uniref:DUF3325 domain-containing protein n=1 Tax=Sphingopyxis panaciterrae TaxID=363841 RepID=UPI00141F53C7|nr:DUF3325 domain-containing protein [Sphingopyxis panaciterrae]NIJ39189.1 hypothetical protein [Sphingopyxis panaciterrae]